MPDFIEPPHDERDPSPWRALYLDQSTPLPDDVKAAWLRDCSSGSRQYLLDGIDDIKDDLFLRHDLNLFNFVIRLNNALRAAGQELQPVAEPDFSMLSEPPLRLQDMPRGRLNLLDLQSAIEVYTPVYQLLLTDNDFWRASNSLQLDETVANYAAKILASPEHLVMLNNKHPLVPLSTLRAGHRLVLHGLSTEMLHCLLMKVASGDMPLPARELARMREAARSQGTGTATV
jgi:hypothetical protein